MSAEKRGPATVKQVAAMAGVSPTVVSRVLHGKAAGIRVSEQTAERVREAAKALGYRRNALAGSLRDRKTMMLGVIHGVDASRARFSGESRYFAALMDGIVDGAFEHGYSVTLCPKLQGEGIEDAMSDGRFDGLIWYRSTTLPEEKRIIQQSTLPLVVIHDPAPSDGGNVAGVQCDNEQGIGIAIDHLLGLGHNKIGFAIENHFLQGEGLLRRHAFVEVAKRKGITDPESLLVCFNEPTDLVPMIKERGLTALICWNDGTAATVLRTVQQNGVRVPEDLSIIGFDSTIFCDTLTPPLTSVAQPLETMGMEAAKALVGLIENPVEKSFNIVLPCGLDIRGSTAKP